MQIEELFRGHRSSEQMKSGRKRDVPRRLERDGVVWMLKSSGYGVR